jgi:leader peptidase (prepilin peptidase) / N-methyltransferase
LQDLVYIIFFFALGACVGSFLNVVVWRLPRNESIVSPPSRCPFCEHRLAWYDNIPVFGWLALRGRCRYCFNPISARYPTVEFLVGAMFVLFYVSFFIFHQGPCWIEIRFNPMEEQTQSMYYGISTIAEDWPIYLLAVFTMSCLLAAALIDAKNYFIPMSIPILMLIVGIVWHTILDRPKMPMSLVIQKNAVLSAMAIGGGIGLVISNVLMWKGLMLRSFADGYPLLEIEKDPPPPREPNGMQRLVGRMIEAYRRPLTPEQQKTMHQYRAAAEAREKQKEADWKKEVEASMPPPKDFTPADIRREMGHEILFLLPPLIGSMAAGAAVLLVPAFDRTWSQWLAGSFALGGLAGSVLGALVGGFVIWLLRIFGSIAFGREAMGMGDVHLMFAIGAIVGAAGATLVFFISPFAGVLFALYKWLFGRGHELPYGPYIALATAILLIFYCPIVGYLAPGVEGLILVLRQFLLRG